MVGRNHHAIRGILVFTNSLTSSSSAWPRKRLCSSWRRPSPARPWPAKCVACWVRRGSCRTPEPLANHAGGRAATVSVAPGPMGPVELVTRYVLDLSTVPPGKLSWAWALHHGWLAQSRKRESTGQALACRMRRRRRDAVTAGKRCQRWWPMVAPWQSGVQAPSRSTSTTHD